MNSIGLNSATEGDEIVGILVRSFELRVNNGSKQ
jgi:hypothetical protein